MLDDYTDSRISIVDITSNRQRVCWSLYIMLPCAICQGVSPYTHGLCVLSGDIWPQCLMQTPHRVHNYIACECILKPYD